MSTAQAREFEFTAADFERVRKLIHEHAGIALSGAKQDMVYSRLARRLRAVGDKTFAQYLARLERGDRREWETFINALTTNLTSFFREAHHFETLARHLAALGGRRPLRIWCSAASTGEEPYSIAMTAVDAFNSFTPPVAILASDLDTSVLAQGEAGIYPQERVDKLPRETVARFFLKGANAQAGMVRVRPELQRLISFKRINLLDAHWPVEAPLDAIFCRNVMIYFASELQSTLWDRFSAKLNDDGMIYIGHSERVIGPAAGVLNIEGPTAYRKKVRAAA